MGNPENWEIWKGVRFDNWRQSLYVVKIKNPLVPRKSRELGRYRGFGRFERFRRFGEFWRLKRLGDSGEWEVSETGKNHYIWQKLRTHWNPGGFGRLGVSEDWEIGDFRNSGDLG